MMLASLETQSRLAPRCAWTWTADTGLSFTTTVWMIIRVHNGTANCRSDAHVTGSTSFTNVDQGVFAIAHNTDCCAADDWNHSHFA